MAFFDVGGRLAFNTLLLATSVTLVSLLLGVPLAFALVRTNLSARRMAGVLLVGLLFVPLYLQASAWQAVWGVRGWLTLLLNFHPLEGWPATIWIHSAAAVPWVVLIVGIGLRLVEPELEEDALLDAPLGTVFLRVTLRRAAAAIAAAAVWIAANTAGEMSVTDLYQIQTMAEGAYTFIAATSDATTSLNQSLPGLCILSGLLVLAMIAVGRRISFDRIASPRLSMTFPLGRWRLPTTIVTWAFIAILVGVPIVGLLHKAGIVVTRTESDWLRQWSPLSCVQMIVSSGWRLKQELKWSLLISASAATLAVAVAIPLAWSARRGGWRSLTVGLVTATTLVLPGPIIGILIIQLFHLTNHRLIALIYDHTIVAPVLAQTIRALPLAILVLWYAFRSVPTELLQSAAVDGAGPIAVVFKVALPMRRPAIIVAWLIAFAVAIGDLAATILAIPPGVDTLAIRIFGLIHFGVDDQVAGATLALFLFFALVATTAIYIGSRSRPERPV